MDNRIVFIQAGDFAAAYERLRRGDPESSHSQKYSMDYVSSLKSRAEFVCVLCTSDTYEFKHLDNGVDAIGVQYFSGHGGKYRHPDRLIPALAELRPTQVISRQPIPEVMDWCKENNVDCLPMWADSYGSRFREMRFRRLLHGALKRSQLRWVANHQIDACRTLTKLGLKEECLVPWDWPQQHLDDEVFQPKQCPAADKEISICYAGRIEAHKGVEDLIRAVRVLRQRGRKIRLSLYGDGEDIAKFEKKIRAFDLQDSVELVGRIPVAEVVVSMNRHDIVVVPSRHYSNEGMPNTIRQAVRSRSPLIVSDHPAFRSVVENGVNSIVFKAQKPMILASAIEMLCDDKELYERLSRIELSDLLNKVPDWHQVIDHWLGRDFEWMAQHSLFALSRPDR